MTEDTQLQAIKAFAAELAASDENERAALIARAKMIAMQQADPEAFEAPIRTLGEYIDTPIEIPPVLVEPALLVRGSILCTVGRAGKGKTQVNLNRIMKWSVGRSLFDGLTNHDGVAILGPNGPLRTLIIENEGAAGMFHRQVGVMLNAADYLTDEERKVARENILVWGDGGWSGLKLDDPQQLNMVRAGCEQHKPDILFVEPFRGLWQGDENSSTDMVKVVDALSGIASDYNCGVVLTHHERKSGTSEDGEKMSSARGSSVLEGVVATMENFEIAKGGDLRELSWSKVRYGGGHAILPVRMQWQPGDWWYKHVALDQIEQETLNALADSDPEPMTIRDLMETLGEKEHAVRRIVKRLLESTPPKIRKAPSGAQGGGNRYRVASPNTEDREELDF